MSTGDIDDHPGRIILTPSNGREAGSYEDSSKNVPGLLRPKTSTLRTSSKAKNDDKMKSPRRRPNRLQSTETDTTMKKNVSRQDYKSTEGDADSKDDGFRRDTGPKAAPPRKQSQMLWDPNTGRYRDTSHTKRGRRGRAKTVQAKELADFNRDTGYEKTNKVNFKDGAEWHNEIQRDEVPLQTPLSRRIALWAMSRDVYGLENTGKLHSPFSIPNDLERASTTRLSIPFKSSNYLASESEKVYQNILSLKKSIEELRASYRQRGTSTTFMSSRNGDLDSDLKDAQRIWGVDSQYLGFLCSLLSSYSQLLDSFVEYILLTFNPHADPELKLLAMKVGIFAQLRTCCIEEFLDYLRDQVAEPGFEIWQTFWARCYASLTTIFTFVPSITVYTAELLGDLALRADKKDLFTLKGRWSSMAFGWYKQAIHCLAEAGDLYYKLSLCFPNDLLHLPKRIRYLAIAIMARKPYKAAISDLRECLAMITQHVTSPEHESKPPSYIELFYTCHSYIINKVDQDTWTEQLGQFLDTLEQPLSTFEIDSPMSDRFPIDSAELAILALYNYGEEPAKAEVVGQEEEQQQQHHDDDDDYSKNIETEQLHAAILGFILLQRSFVETDLANQLAHVNVWMMFFYQISIVSPQMPQVLKSAPWAELCAFLNRLLDQSIGDIAGSRLLQVAKREETPLPGGLLIDSPTLSEQNSMFKSSFIWPLSEDWDIKAFTWGANLCWPQGFFSEAELPPSEIFGDSEYSSLYRLGRILWLASRLAANHVYISLENGKFTTRGSNSLQDPHDSDNKEEEDKYEEKIIPSTENVGSQQKLIPLVADTNIFLKALSLCRRVTISNGFRLLVPEPVLYELAKLKNTGHSKLVVQSAKEASDFLQATLESGTVMIITTKGDVINRQRDFDHYDNVADEFRNKSCDELIVDCIRQWHKSNPEISDKSIFISNDRNLRLIARAKGLKTADSNELEVMILSQMR